MTQLRHRDRSLVIETDTASSFGCVATTSSARSWHTTRRGHSGTFRMTCSF